MVVAGSVTVKVELDGSDVPSDIARAVNSQLKPALAKAENEVSQSTRKIKKSVESVGPSLGGVGNSVSNSLRPALRGVENDVDRSMSGVRSKIASIGTAFAGLAGKFGGPASNIAVAAGNVTTGLAGIGTAGSAAATGMLAVGAAAAASVAAVAAIGAAAGVVGKQFYDLGAESDALSDKLLIKTGGSQAEIEKLRGSIEKLGTTNVPLSFDAIGDVAVDVTRNLGLTGVAMEELTSRIANFQRNTGEVINVKALSQAFKQLGVEAGDQVGALNELGEYSRQTGMSLNAMVESLASGGSALAGTGLTFSESAGLLGQLTEAGVDAQKVIPGITKLLREAPKKGVSGATLLADGVTQMKALIAAGRDIEAKGLADELFGRGSLPLFEAIKKGKIDLDNLKLDGPVRDINEIAGATDDWSERWKILQNSIKKALAPLGEAVFDKVGAELTKLADWITANQDEIVLFFVDLGKAFIDIGSAAMRGIGEAVRALGYLIAPIGDVLGALSKVDAAIADATGDRAEGDRLRAQAEDFFGWGESLTKVGEAAIDASKGSERAKDGLDRIGEGIREATKETNAFGEEVAALPVDGVDVPLTVSGIPEADAAMDDLFTKYRTLSVGVEIGDAAVAGAIAGDLLGANVDTSVSGEAARKFANEVMAPMWRQQGFTVGDHAADEYGEHQNGAVDVMVNSIAEGNKVLNQALRDPNAYGIIFNNQVYGYGQGSKPRPYSGGNTGDPTQDHKDHVHIWYKPGDGNPPPPGMPTAPAAAPPGMPPPVDPGAAPVPVTVAPIEVDVVELFSDPTDDPELNRLQAQADAAENTRRAQEASRARTAAAQAVADAQATADAALLARDTLNSDTLADIADRTKAEEDYQKSLKDLTKAQQDQTDLIQDQQDQQLKDQISNRQQANSAAKAAEEAAKKAQEPFDYTKLPLGDPNRIAAQAFMGAGGTAEEFDALMRGKAGPATQQAVGQAAAAAAQPIGQAAGDAAAAAINTNLLPVGTPTAADTETNRLLAERNPAALAKVAGFEVADYTRQGGDSGEIQANEGPGFDANGRIMGDTAAMIDRTLTSMEAANKARQDQLLGILQQIATKVGVEVLAPVVNAATTAAMTGIAADIGTAMGETAGPIIGTDTAEAVDQKVQAQESQSGTAALPGMAGGGGIFGGTPGKDSVPAMLMPGEWVLTTADVARLGGFAGVERILGSLQANGGMRYYASGGGVGRASTGNPNGGQNVNATVGADFFGLSQIPVLAAAINALTQVLLKIIDVEIMQRDALIEVTKEFRDFRGDFKAFDAAGRIKNDNSGLSDRTSSSQKQAADERLRILKMVIDGLVKYIIEKILVPLGKAIGSAVVSAIAGAAGGALSGAGGAIAGGVVSAAISAAGQVAIDIAAEIFTIAAETLITIGLDVIGEFLQTLFPQLTTSLLGGAVLEQIAGPVSQVMIGAIGVVTSLTTNLLSNLGGLFANFIPTLQTLLAGFVPLTASLSGLVGVLSSIAAVLQQILTALLNLGAGIASPIVSAVTSALGGFIPLVSSLGTTTNLLGGVSQTLAGLVPNLGTMSNAVGASGASLAATLVGVGTVVNSLLKIQAPTTAVVNPIAAVAATTASNVNQLVTALSSGTLAPRATTVNAPITVISATTQTATNIANRLLALTG